MVFSPFFPASRARRRGISMFLFIGSLPVLIGVTGLVIDLSTLYTKRAVAQRAADAAALAGCLISKPDLTLASGSNDTEINAEAVQYANNNGYFADRGATITVDPHVNNQLGRVQVTVSRFEPMFFMPILETLSGGDPAFSRQVLATATAEKVVPTAMSLGGNYGTTTGASNPSAFGPYALHSYGDPYSVKYHDNGTPNDADHISSNKGDPTAYKNAQYNPDGFSYTMSVSDAFVAKNTSLRVQLYDPDGYDSKDNQSLDEIHTDYVRGHPPKQSATTTKYTVFKVGPNKELIPVPGATITYGNDQSVDAAFLKKEGKDPWVTPSGFKIDLATQGAGEYKIRVQTTDGSSENGYNLRAGPDYDGIKSESDWNQTYGDKNGLSPNDIQVPITADNNLQMNFTRSDRVRVRLGYLPASVAGRSFEVSKFDTDVGSTEIKYSYIEDNSTVSKTPSNNNYLVPTNDFWSKDKVEVPAGFRGGFWYAEYNAGRQDTSNWAITYAGLGDGVVRLIR